MVLIRWHGHACFELIDDKGFSIVIDPHDGGSIGLNPPKAKADAVLITHEHFDHNAYGTVLKKGGERVSMKTGKFVVGGHEVLGIKAYHDKFKGRRRGSVVMYLIDVDGVKILHVGDLGHTLTGRELEMVREADIAMLPVGGTFTINAAEAAELSKNLNAKAVIPMHYWVEGINLPLKPVDEFLNRVDYEVIRLKSNEWSVSRNELSSWEGTKVVVFELPK